MLLRGGGRVGLVHFKALKKDESKPGPQEWRPEMLEKALSGPVPEGLGLVRVGDGALLRLGGHQYPNHGPSQRSISAMGMPLRVA